MPPRTSDHGHAPDPSPVALVLIDVINDFDFDDAEALLRQARPASERIAVLKRNAHAAGVPVIYANDNFGRWRDDFAAVVSHCLRDDSPGGDVVERLRPADDDYFVLKPKHSAFFATTLEPLLGHLGVESLVLAGFTGDICVLATAIDAYMRDLRLVIPSDAVASVDPEETDRALAYARRVLDAETPEVEAVDFAALREA
jgi:nicotinamidase-related amidase